MSGTGKALLGLALLVITNLGTFGYATWRCRQTLQGQERLLAEATQQQGELRAQVAGLQQRLDRLRVWGEFIQLQQDLDGVHLAINQLNYGNAIQALDRVAKKLQDGEYGQLFQQRRPELLPPLEQAKQKLRATNAGARSDLIEVDQAAFRIIAGIAAPGELAGASAAVAPTPVPSPTPEATPMLPPPAPTPSPTPKAGVA